MPQPPTSSQRAAQHVDFCRRFGKREERRAETHLQVVALEKAAQKVGQRGFQVGKATRSSTHRPSIWWNIGEWVASESTRYPGPAR